jgi:hypothetical protein
MCTYGAAATGVPRERSTSRTICARATCGGQFALDAQLLVAHQLDVPVLLDQLDDAHRVDRRVGLEGDVMTPGAASTFTTP